MKLYHYTGSGHVESIRRQGVRPGGVPLANPTATARGIVAPRFVPGIWLTESDDWAAQSWATTHLDMPDTGHKCDRTEARFTVAVPKPHRQHLMTWRDTADWLVSRALATREFVDEMSWDGSEHWWVWIGQRAIPAGWLRAQEWRPGFVPPEVVQRDDDEEASGAGTVSVVAESSRRRVWLPTTVGEGGARSRDARPRRSAIAVRQDAQRQRRRPTG